ncbi:MAG: tyrosine-type recombinase/integrase [Cyanobacteria bacterium J06642_3]
MAKNNRTGQAALWDSSVIKKLRLRLVSSKQRLIFEISLFTGERMGAITQLKVSDVYDERGRVRDKITFDGATRKATRWGQAKTRSVKIHDELKFFLKQYQPPQSGYLFPSVKSKSGHITVRGVDDYWRTQLSDLGYSGFSTHSSRRWLINKLAKAGIQIQIIAEFMAMTISTVRRYLDEDPEACDNAIASLTI